MILRHKNSHFFTSSGVSKVSERMNERSGAHERSEQGGASERVSGASERANGRASGPVLQSVFLAVIDHSAIVDNASKRMSEQRKRTSEWTSEWPSTHILIFD